MSQSLFLWDPFKILEGPHEKDRICCGLTKRKTPCKLYITKDVHNAGVKKLHTLACQPFDPVILQDRLQDIVADFLCARWHRRLQVDEVRKQWEAAAIRNQARAQAGRHGSVTGTSAQVPSETRVHSEQAQSNTPSSSSSLIHAHSTPAREREQPLQDSGTELTEAALRENQVPWVVSEARPAMLGMRNEGGEKVYIHLQSFRPTSSLGVDCCGICHGEDRNEPVVLKCGRCTTYVHLKCMSLWVQSHRSGSRTSCITCRDDRPFYAYYDTPTAETIWSQQREQQESATGSDDSDRTATTHDDSQPLVPITTPVKAGTSTATTFSSDAEQNAHTATQRPEQVEYPHLPTIPVPQNRQPLRRSDRESRPPSRFIP